MACEQVSVRRSGSGRLQLAALVLALAACGGEFTGAGDLPPAVSSAGQALPTASTLRTTNRPLDVGIDGAGAFVLRDPRTGAQVLSRLGHFDIDAQGRLINDEAWLVEGVSGGPMPSTLAALAPLPAISTTVPPVATRRVSLEANLDARASVPDSEGVTPRAFDPLDPTSYHHVVGAELHDAAGRSVSLTLFFRKMAPTLWNVYASVNGSAILPDGEGSRQPIVQLNYSSPIGSAPINPAAVHQPLPPIVIDPALGSGSATPAIGAFSLDLSAVSAYSANFAVTALQQDGSPQSSLSSVSVRPTGELVLAYGHSRVDDSRRLVLARTTVADRLDKYGASGWVCGPRCQSPVVARPGELLTGTLVPGALNAGD